MIYEPREDSELLGKYVKKYAFGNVLDMGTGSGVQAKNLLNKKSVKRIIGADISKEAISHCKRNIKSKKVDFLVSDLFSKVNGKFDTVVFNPPYLPKDKWADDNADRALYGGKKGYEIVERFLDSVNNYLSAKGVVLILFSSLTNKEKINQIIEKNLLVFKELEKKHFFFEDLFVYKIVKSDVLKNLEKRGISKIEYLTHGKRGNIFVGYHRGKKVAIKIKRKESLAVERMKNEVKWLKVLNEKKVGPKLLFYGKNYLVYKFAEGEFILDWIKKNKNDKKKIKKVIVKILQQCFIVDNLKLNKEEMHRPVKHIVINNRMKVTLLDFDRCYKTKKPHNVTQFGVFLVNHGLARKKRFINLLKDYKKEMSKSNLIKIINSLD